jgi:energy-coupling factor transport system permease protein
MVPLLAQDAARMREAYGLRADAARADTRRARLRRAGRMTRALGAGALERAMDAAASLEVRGYGARPPARRIARDPLPWSRDDRAFALAAVLLALVPVALRVASAGWFDPYPAIDADTGAGVLCAAAALGGIALVPFALSVRRRARRITHAGSARA